MEDSSSSVESSQNTADGCLILDAHTLKDLEIFSSEEGDATLFQFCNRARTEGGARRLKQRMELPSSNPETNPRNPGRHHVYSGKSGSV